MPAKSALEISTYCSIYNRFTSVAREHADKVAAADCEGSVTYKELLFATSDLAARIASAVPDGRPVGILLPSGIDMLVAALACLASNCPYVPLDPGHPEPRNRTAIADAKLAALIGTRPVPGQEDLPLLQVRESPEAEVSPRCRRTAPDEPAAIFYTSGSTGTPKGVCLDEHAILERAHNATVMMQITSADNLALLSAPTAIASLWMTSAAVLNGATLHVIDPRRLGVGETLRLFRKRQISATFAVPALLRELCLSPEAPFGFHLLRVLRTGGDVLPSRDLRLWRSVLPPSCRLWISLASTEMPAVFQWIVPPGWTPDGPTLPVGYPRPAIAYQVADEVGTPVAHGATGELIVNSRELALGYWADGALTHFPTASPDSKVRSLSTKDLVRFRPDGLVEMVGRKDRQVKIDGHRFNLNELETALRACSGIFAGAAIAARNEELELEIVAFVVPLNPVKAPSAEALRSYLKTQIPRHMIPRRIHTVERIPLLPTFKVDVRNLEAIDRSRREQHFRPPAGSAVPVRPGVDVCGAQIRQAVRIAWTEALKGAPFDECMSFDAAGGDSLGALHMWSLIESALKVTLSFEALDTGMTPWQLADSIRQQCNADSSANRSVRSRPLRIFYMPTASGDTILQAKLRKAFGGSISFEVPRYPAVQEMLDGGSVFQLMVDDVVRQITKSLNGPLYIMGYSFGGFVAWAVARRVKELGGQIGMVILIDARRHEDTRESLSKSRYFAQIGMRILREPRYASQRLLPNILALLVNNPKRRLVAHIIRASALLPSRLRFMFELHFNEQFRMACARKWSPEPLDCRTVLFRSNEFASGNPDFGWGSLCPSLQVASVGGTHDSLLQSPDREYLCERILSSVSAQEKEHRPTLTTQSTAAAETA